MARAAPTPPLTFKSSPLRSVQIKIMNLTIIASLTLLLLNEASAFALSEDDKDGAIKAAENSELGGTIECGRGMGNPIDLDINLWT